jgi:hypothetical protein
MASSLVYGMMALNALLLFAIPFVVFMGLGGFFASVDDIWLIVLTILVCMIVSYGTSFGSFALIQKNSCDKVNYKHVALNSLIPLGFLGGFLVLAAVFPGLRAVVGNLFPPTMSPELVYSAGYGYYSFWATLFGTAIGGFLSAACVREETKVALPVPAPEPSFEGFTDKEDEEDDEEE